MWAYGEQLYMRAKEKVGREIGNKVV